MTKEDVMKLSNALPSLSEEKIRLLRIVKGLCTKEEKRTLASKTEKQLKEFIAEKLKNKC